MSYSAVSGRRVGLEGRIPVPCSSQERISNISLDTPLSPSFSPSRTGGSLSRRVIGKQRRVESPVRQSSASKWAEETPVLRSQGLQYQTQHQGRGQLEKSSN